MGKDACWAGLTTKLQSLKLTQRWKEKQTFLKLFLYTPTMCAHNNNNDEENNNK